MISHRSCDYVLALKLKNSSIPGKNIIGSKNFITNFRDSFFAIVTSSSPQTQMFRGKIYSTSPIVLPYKKSVVFEPKVSLIFKTGDHIILISF